jgi:hypothetical protein
VRAIASLVCCRMLTGLAALSLGEALPPFTSNVADHLRLSSSKGAYDGIWSYRVVWSGGASQSFGPRE